MQGHALHQVLDHSHSTDYWYQREQTKGFELLCDQGNQGRGTGSLSVKSKDLNKQEGELEKSVNYLIRQEGLEVALVVKDWVVTVNLNATE